MSRWLDGVGKEKYNAGERLYDRDATANTCPTMTQRCLKRGLPTPDLATIKDFLRFHVAISRGRIDEEGRITADSVNTFAEWFLPGMLESPVIPSMRKTDAESMM
jgi:hypothetical protein